jgi:hypothetical protein
MQLTNMQGTTRKVPVTVEVTIARHQEPPVPSWTDDFGWAFQEGRGTGSRDW